MRSLISAPSGVNLKVHHVQGDTRRLDKMQYRCQTEGGMPSNKIEGATFRRTLHLF